MSKRISSSWLVLCLAASIGWGASVELAQELYMSGDLEGARAELQEVLTATGDDSGRASALELLGRIEIDRKDWSAAVEAWGALTDSYALSPEATAVSLAIRPLQALVDCGCGSVTTPSAPTPDPVVEPAGGLFLVGGWGPEYDAAQEVTRSLIEFLDANGVGVRAASTEIPAIRGEEVVLSFLLEEARVAGAEGVIYVTTRFSHREYVQVQRFDLNGLEQWMEKVTGGTALKERRDRGRTSWNLVDRIKTRLSKRLGTPYLPTRE